jgi:hypothetical protein
VIAVMMAVQQVLHRQRTDGLDLGQDRRGWVLA